MNWKLIAGIGLLIASFWSGWLINGWRYERAQAVEKAETVQARADHFRTATEKINVEANQYSGNSGQLKKKIDSLKKDLANAQKNNPVSSDCRPDPDRLRIIKSAVTAANTAAGQ